MNAYGVQYLKDRGISIAGLGCVMFDVEPLPVAREVPETWGYSSTNPERFWIKGMKAGDHITLLYGLLESAHEMRAGVDEVLARWEPGRLSIASVSSFPSTFEDEPYACIIGHIEKTPELLDAHARLSLLPHIDTHPEYKPHLTLGYVKARYEQAAIECLRVFEGKALRPVGLNYGDPNR